MNAERNQETDPVWFKRALVTGASGCIGRCLVKRLTAVGCQVNALDLDEAGLRKLGSENPPGTVVAFQGSLEDPGVLARAGEGVGAVFHAAAKVHAIPRNALEEAEFFRINVAGTENLLTHCAGPELHACIFFSTIAVYGVGDGKPLNETTPLNPDNAYAKSKLEAEQRVREFFASRAMKPTIFRMSLVYGEGERGNFSRMMRSVDRGRFVMVGNGMTRKSMIYVEDVVSAAMLAANNAAGQGETFVLSDPEPYALKEIVGVLAKHLGRRPPWIRLPVSMLRAGGSTLGVLGRTLGFKPMFTRPDVDKLMTDTICDVSKIQRVLGFESRYGLEEGVRRTVQWFRQSRTEGGR